MPWASWCNQAPKGLTMKEYIITLRHDAGQIRILTTASSQEQAVKQVCDYEFAPLSAVISVEMTREFF